MIASYECHGWPERSGLHSQRPEDSHSYSPPKLLKGKVAQKDLSKVEEICRRVPPHKEQIIGGVSFGKDC